MRNFNRVVLARPTIARNLATGTKTLKEGDKVPNVVFKARVRDESLGGENPFKWKNVSTADLFNNKRVVVFALPGGKHYIFFQMNSF